jgi:hypothetical protein
VTAHPEEPVPHLADEDIARVCHEAIRALQLALGEEPAPEWDNAPEEQHASTLEHVQHARDGGGSPELLHEMWCRAKRRDGWRYGEVKKVDDKLHPHLVAYDQLPPEQQAKDELVAGIVVALTTEE